MRRLICVLLFLLIAPAAAQAATLFGWSPALDWAKYETPGYSARLAVAVVNTHTGEEYCRTWDDPADRMINCTIDMTSRVQVSAVGYEYGGGRWLPGFDYGLGKRIMPDAFIYVPQIYYLCSTAGLSGGAEPRWTAIQISAGDITDTGAGTVLIPAPAHGWQAGDTINISGTANYDGDHVLPAQINGSADFLEITAAHVAEVIFKAVNLTPLVLIDGAAQWTRTEDIIPWQAGHEYGPEARIAPFVFQANVYFVPDNTGVPWHCYSSGGDITDTGAGTVLIPTAGSHGFTEGDLVRVQGTTNYDGLYTVPVQASGDSYHLELTAAHVAETITYEQVALLSVVGASGAEEPDWDSIGNMETIDDNDITWTRREDRAVVISSGPSWPLRLKPNHLGTGAITDTISVRGKCVIRSGAAR